MFLRSSLNSTTLLMLRSVRHTSMMYYMCTALDDEWNRDSFDFIENF